MFPFNFEWIWDMPHMVFMGGLWYALIILSVSLMFCIVRAVMDTAGSNAGNPDH